MIEAKVINLMKHELNNVGNEYRLYVVKKNETCFYVGQSVDVVNRLYEHLGYGERSAYPSLLGQFIKKNSPKSKDFDIVFMCPDEVSSEYKGVILDITKDANWDKIQHLYPDPKIKCVFPDWEVNLAERDLISSLSPVFNVTYNSTPGRLPAEYIDPRNTDLQITVSDFIPF